MSRKRKTLNKVIEPDKIYNSKLITKLINNIMEDGKKNTAKKILYSSFELIGKKTKEKPMIIFEKALENVMPHLELRSRRIGGSNYQVPFEVKGSRKIILALRWIVLHARLRKEKTMIDKLANEIIDASNNTGGSVKKRETVHKMADANKAFAHYRW